jgi:outer membrane receptor for ferrienterochelin and colicins
VNTYVNVYKFKTTGGTLVSDVAWKHLSATVGASYIGRYNEFTEQDNSLPDLLWTPEFNATVSYAIEKIRNTLSLYYKYTGKRASYAIDNETTQITLGKIQDFNFLDFSTSQRITNQLNLTAGVRNVFNITQLQNTSQDTGGAHSSGASIPLSYGRSYFATISFSFSK